MNIKEMLSHKCVWVSRQRIPFSVAEVHLTIDDILNLMKSKYLLFLI